VVKSLKIHIEHKTMNYIRGVELQGSGCSCSALICSSSSTCNVYCPNDRNGTGAKDPYKADPYWVLRARVQGLVDEEGREVVLVGDIDAFAALIDHGEGHSMVQWWQRGLQRG
jgi:exonuclease III